MAEKAELTTQTTSPRSERGIDAFKSQSSYCFDHELTAYQLTRRPMGQRDTLKIRKARKTQGKDQPRKCELCTNDAGVTFLLTTYIREGEPGYDAAVARAKEREQRK